jgi:hypothetical protein
MAIQEDKDRKLFNELLESFDGDREKALESYTRIKCKTDLYFLATFIFDMDKAKESGRKRWDPEFHKWMCEVLQTPEDTLLIVPRGHMKSTMLKLRLVQMILVNPMIRMGVWSRTAGLAEAQLADLKVLLSTPKLRAIFPDIIPDPGRKYGGWDRSTQSELTVHRSREWGRIPQENQVEAWGSGATVTGRHYDVIVMDDILNEQSCSTPEQIMKVRDYYAYVQSIKEPTGWEYIVGTRYHHADLYGTIIKEKWFGDRVFIRSAYEDGEPIYRFFTKAMLEKIRRRQGAFQYSCQYLNNPIPSEEQIFPPPHPTYEYLPQDDYQYFMTVDPAATTESYSDDTAIVIGALNRVGRLFVVEAIAVKEAPNIIADRIITEAVKYKVKKIGIELGLQAALQYIVDMKVEDYKKSHEDWPNPEMVSIKVPRNISKAQRVNRSLGAFMRDGKLKIQKDLVPLMLQMEFFPRGEHDDLVDCLAMQFQLIDRFSTNYWEMSGDMLPRVTTYRSLFATRKTNTWEERFV